MKGRLKVWGRMGPWIGAGALAYSGLGDSMADFEYNAVVAQRVEVAPGLLILRTVPRGWEPAPFKAGQYTVLGLRGDAPRLEGCDPEVPPPEPGKVIRRAYSIASSSVDRSYLEFYIALVKSGALTPRLFALRVGDPLFLSPRPVGIFTLDRVPEGHHLVLVATGTGLAPYMSMLRTHLMDPERGKTVVLHGARHSWDLGYRAELETMQRLSPRFNYIPVVSDPREEIVPWSGFTGFLHHFWTSPVRDLAFGFTPRPQDTHVFLCGNPLMVEAMMEVLAAEGFAEGGPGKTGQIHREKYW